jgi:lysozyme
MALPNAGLDVSAGGLSLIASFEGWRGDLYDDVAGNATIGYGHLVHAGPVTAADRGGPYGNGITQAQGLALLHGDAARMVEAVRSSVTVPLTQDQFDALVSFTYNVGAGAFEGSTLLRLLNAGDYAGARAQFAVWDKAGGQVVPGLVRRRAAEAALFGGAAAAR